MDANSQIILDGILERFRTEAYPEEKPEFLFEVFTANQVLKKYNLPYDDLESGLIGGGGDGGVDGFYLFVNGNLAHEDTEYNDLKEDIVMDLIIFQAKTHTGFKETPIERFITFSMDLFDLSREDLTTHDYNKSLIDAIQLFHKLYKDLSSRFPTLKVSFFYASKGSCPSEGVIRKATVLQNTVSELFPAAAEVNCEFLGADKLYNLAKQQPRKRYELKLAETPISPEKGGYICLVNLIDFYEFISNNGKELENRLFEDNVRDYQGSTQVNRKIKESLNNAQEEFWWLNNGISIVAIKVLPSNRSLTIEDPQIVNGIQTSKEVYNYCSTLKRPESRKILVRIVTPEADVSRDRIIVATNSQNTIAPPTLRATESIHRNIEEYMLQKDLYYDRRKNYYKNKGKRRSQIIPISKLAQAVMAIYLRKPNVARARPSSLLKKDEDYIKVFNLDYPINIYYVCAQGMQKVECCLKSLISSSADRANLKFYVAMHAIAGINKVPPKPKIIAEFDLSRLNDTTIKQSLDFIRPIYDRLGATDQVSKGAHLLAAILKSVD